ncbi:MAG TPA: hypothetical protein VIW94_02545 [Acidimicrobiia bacterium]
MIGALLEGIGQSLLPCSWILLVPAIGIGVALPGVRVMAAMFSASLGFAWLAVSGWWVLPLPLSGLLIVVGAVLWWYRDLDIWSAALIGAGAAAAWQPCVGPELGAVLNLAQTDPLAAAPGLAAFILGVSAVGLGIGWAIGHFLPGRFYNPTVRAVTVVIGATGVSMIVGLYPALSSALAGWSYALWA